MYVGTDFQPENHGEDEVFGFDFVRDLATGDSLVTSAWTCAVSRGVDSGAASHVVGSATIQGTQTLQRVSGLLAGVRYILQATVTTAQGKTLILYSHITCEPVA